MSSFFSSKPTVGSMGAPEPQEGICEVPAAGAQTPNKVWKRLLAVAMVAIAVLTLAATASSIGAGAATATTYKVTATNGTAIRQSANAQSKQLGVFAYGSVLVVTSIQNFGGYSWGYVQSYTASAGSWGYMKEKGWVALKNCVPFTPPKTTAKTTTTTKKTTAKPAPTTTKPAATTTKPKTTNPSPPTTKPQPTTTKPVCRVNLSADKLKAKAGEPFKIYATTSLTVTKVVLEVLYPNGATYTYTLTSSDGVKWSKTGLTLPKGNNIRILAKATSSTVSAQSNWVYVTVI
jgi:hypothetical protein